MTDQQTDKSHLKLPYRLFIGAEYPISALDEEIGRPDTHLVEAVATLEGQRYTASRLLSRRELAQMHNPLFAVRAAQVSIESDLRAATGHDVYPRGIYVEFKTFETAMHFVTQGWQMPKQTGGGETVRR